MIEPDEHLTKREKDYFKKIRDGFPHDWFSDPDADMLNAYVCSKYRALDMEKQMRTQGATIPGSRGTPVSNPIIRMLNAEHRKMASLATKLRITKSTTKNPDSIDPAKRKQSNSQVALPVENPNPVKKKRAYTISLNGKRARRIPFDHPSTKLYNYVERPNGKPIDSQISDVMILHGILYETDWSAPDDRSQMAKDWRKYLNEVPH